MAKRVFTEEEARQRKNERQRRYSKETDFESQKRYREKNKEQNKERTTNIYFRAYAPQDNDIITFLDTVPNKATYLKELIRADIERRRAAGEYDG